MKLSIYVPDERAGDIEKWRDRLNFSQLFLQAIDREIALRARVSKVKDKDMKEAIERLKREASETYDEGRTAGMEAGAVMAKDSLSAEDMRRISSEELSADDLIEMVDNYYGWCDLADTVDEEARASGDAKAYRSGWAAGVKEAVSEVWRAVEDAID